MIRRRLQAVLGLVLLAVLGWAAVCVWFGREHWAAAGPLLALAGYALFMGLEMLVMAWVSRRDPVQRSGLLSLWRAWWGEVRTGLRVFAWEQPFRERAVADALGVAPGQRGVLLVHGFMCNRGMWNRWMRRLTQQRVPFMAVSLEPPFVGIRQMAPALESAAAALTASTGLAPVVVAHSMGGLVARCWLAGRGGVGSVHRLITLGSPHAGTWTAQWATKDNTVDMRPGSELLRWLDAAEGPSDRAHISCVVSDCDNIVYPISTGLLPGSAHLVVRHQGHLQMMEDPQVWALVQQWLGREADTLVRPGPSPG